MVVLGLATAVFAALAGRVQTDIKSALSFASLTQVGLIVAEIGLGLRYIALIHILGHACLRTLQFLRAPTLLHDYRTAGKRHRRAPADGQCRGAAARRRRGGEPGSIGSPCERGYLDACLTDYVARPVLRVLRGCDGLERRWTDFLAGGASRESDAVDPRAGSLEEPDMSQLHLPWLELAIADSAGRARCWSAGCATSSGPGGGAWCSAVRRLPARSARGWTSTGRTTQAAHDRWAFGRVADEYDWIVIDELSAPLLPLAALLYLLTAMATLRTKIRRFSFAGTLSR